MESPIEPIRIDLEELRKEYPELCPYIKENPTNELIFESDYKDEKLQIRFVQILLSKYYNIPQWHLLPGRLVPHPKLREQYLHWISHLPLNIHSGGDTENEYNHPENIRILEIGTGSNCIFPLLCGKHFKWEIVSTDIDSEALEEAEILLKENNIEDIAQLRLQKDPTNIYINIINEGEFFHYAIANPPYYDSMVGIEIATSRLKVMEYMTKGGELEFVRGMIRESLGFRANVGWFSTIVGIQEHYDILYRELEVYGLGLTVKGGVLYSDLYNVKGKHIWLLAWTFV